MHPKFLLGMLTALVMAAPGTALPLATPVAELDNVLIQRNAAGEECCQSCNSGWGSGCVCDIPQYSRGRLIREMQYADEEYSDLVVNIRLYTIAELVPLFFVDRNYKLWGICRAVLDVRNTCPS
jgi:hypothetical protein